MSHCQRKSTGIVLVNSIQNKPESTCMVVVRKITAESSTCNEYDFPDDDTTDDG